MSDPGLPCEDRDFFVISVSPARDPEVLILSSAHYLLQDSSGLLAFHTVPSWSPAGHYEVLAFPHRPLMVSCKGQ